MYHRELTKEIPVELLRGSGVDINILSIDAIHYMNKVVLQIRLNGEMDATAEVKPKGIEFSPSFNSAEPESFEEEDDDGLFYVNDELSKYNVAIRVGNSNDMKLPIVLMQIAKLYDKVITPSNVDRLNATGTGRSTVITLTTKFWNSENSQGQSDFHKLAFLLNAIKEMYGL
ncbi:HHR020Wp [Eremothecium sinecaudum]|uniref:HHR020Wp n=1 Tax=Eremothecium sinecaudum TaxID=45286 RepID=A0A0X8HWI2_9SACH|nr:HHR020Wp [Eremothecium sinecaudum]AMD22789.1 HHR020Wp [Eremothecium sinecaudum]